MKLKFVWRLPCPVPVCSTKCICSFNFRASACYARLFMISVSLSTLFLVPLTLLLPLWLVLAMSFRFRHAYHSTSVRTVIIFHMVAISIAMPVFTLSIHVLWTYPLTLDKKDQHKMISHFFFLLLLYSLASSFFSAFGFISMVLLCFIFASHRFTFSNMWPLFANFQSRNWNIKVLQRLPQMLLKLNLIQTHRQIHRLVLHVNAPILNFQLWLSLANSKRRVFCNIHNPKMQHWISSQLFINFMHTLH